VDFDSSNAFFTQDWFARLWIVQEYVLTSSVKIYSVLMSCHIRSSL
jgi:hypothetical protein